MLVRLVKLLLLPAHHRYACVGKLAFEHFGHSLAHTLTGGTHAPNQPTSPLDALLPLPPPPLQTTLLDNLDNQYMQSTHPPLCMPVPPSLHTCPVYLHCSIPDVYSIPNSYLTFCPPYPHPPCPPLPDDSSSAGQPRESIHQVSRGRTRLPQQRPGGWIRFTCAQQQHQSGAGADDVWSS
jgi:hypothetical protein